MGVRLQTSIYTHETDKLYTISVYDEAYASSAIDFRPDDEGFIINWQGESQDMKVPILTSRCDVNILVDSQDIEDFITDISSAYEGQFRLKITEGSPASGVWYGHIMPDLVQIEDKPLTDGRVSYSFRLTATDGIKRLQKIAYKDVSGPYTGQESITQHLINCVSAIGLTDLMTEESGVLKSQTNWRPSNRIAGDDMDHTYVDHRALYQVDEKGNINYNSVYRVIEQLCLTFHAKFMMADGWYWFIQHNEYENNTVSPDEYDKNKTALGTTIVNSYISVDSVFTGKFGKGYYSFFPPLNAAQINYIHFGYANIAQGYTWSDTATQSVPVSPTEFRVPASTAFFFRANFWHQTRVSGERPYWIKFDVTLTVGTDYLQFEQSVQGTYKYTTTEQTITASVETYELFVPINVTEYQGGIAAGSANFPVEFNTIAFTNEGAVSFDIAFVNLYDYNGNVVSTGINDNKWKFSAVELIPVPTNDVGDWTNTKRYTAYNTTTGNSEAVVINKIIGEDFGYGILRNDSASGKVDSADWGVGASASGVSIEELLGNEYIRTQSVPIKKWVGNFLNADYNPTKSIRHNSDTWVFYKGKWHAGYEYFAGEWYILDTTGTSSNNTDEDIIIGDVPGGGNDVTPSNPTGGSGGGQPTGGTDGTDGVNGSNGVTSVLDALFPRTTADIDSGDAVTTIPIASQTEAGVFKAGQTITVIDPVSGAQQDFTVTSDTAVSDTTISVSSTTANFFFREGSWIVTSQEQQAATGGGSAAMYSQEFVSPSGSTLTVTENSGNLPANEAAISVFWDNGQWISPNYYTVSGSDILLDFTPSDVTTESIWVRFTA